MKKRNSFPRTAVVALKTKVYTQVKALDKSYWTKDKYARLERNMLVYGRPSS
jgi:hypothetical protein